MRQLEVVAVSDDGGYVLLAADENAARATHAIRIDSRLRAALRGDLDDDSDERRESELTPRDIQARLRAGESPEAVARAANVSLSRVMRYAGPVFSERERIVDQAKAAALHRHRGPAVSTPLGTVVDRRLAETTGLKSDTVAWDAMRRDDGTWIVELSYNARGGARTANWLWRPAERELTSLNALATRLGVQDAGKQSARKKHAARQLVTAKRAAPKKATAKKSVPRKSVPKKPAPRKPAQKLAASRKAVPARQAPTPAAPAKISAATKRAAPKRRTPRSQRPVVEPAVKRVNGRVEVPSWSDVLLGVTAPAPARGRRSS